MKGAVLVVVAVLLFSSFMVFGNSTDVSGSGPAKIPLAGMGSSIHSVGKVPKVVATDGMKGHSVSPAQREGGTVIGNRLLPGAMVGNGQESSNSSGNVSTYVLTVKVGVLPYSFLNGSWDFSLWFDSRAYVVTVNGTDYTGFTLHFAGLRNGTYYMAVGVTPYSYYQASYPSIIPINGSNESVDVNYAFANFTFEVYITGVPMMTGMGLWTDYIGMPVGNVSFPPFIDLTDAFFGYSTASDFVPEQYKLGGGANQADIMQAMVEAELEFFGTNATGFFQYNVTMLITNATIVGGAYPAVVFNVTFQLMRNSLDNQVVLPDGMGLYLPPGAVFDNVSMSFFNAPGGIWWNNQPGDYGGVTYGRLGFTQADLSLYNAGNTVGAMNSLMSAYNSTGFSTFAFSWTSLFGGELYVVAAFVPESGTAVIPGYFTSVGGLESSIVSNYNIPLNLSGNISSLENVSVILNSTTLYNFYNNYYPTFAYYYYYQGLQQAINVTMESYFNSPYLPSGAMDFLPVDEPGMAVGGWGWNMKWAYTIFYPAVSYASSSVSGLPSWMGSPSQYSDLNESSSTTYLFGNYANISAALSLYFVNGTEVSPPWGGGVANLSRLVNGSLPNNVGNLSYWLKLLEDSGGRTRRGASYPYYKEGWTPYLVINATVPYRSLPVTFYSGAEAAVGTTLAANFTVIWYTYYNNGSYYQNNSGWKYANSTLVVRLMPFSAPLYSSLMGGRMRNDYVMVFNNSSAYSVTPFAVNYTYLANGTQGDVAGYPSEYADSYISNGSSGAEGVGQAGSVNFLSFGSIEYVLSYALYPYPVPMVYAVGGFGNGTYSRSNPFNYFSFGSYGGETVFDVSTVNASYGGLFDYTGAIGSTLPLSYDNLTTPFAVGASGGVKPEYMSRMANYNYTRFWSSYDNQFYPQFETGNYSGTMFEPVVSVVDSGGWTNVSILNNKSVGAYMYMELTTQGNFSSDEFYQMLADFENSTTVIGSGSNVTVNTTLTQATLNYLLGEISNMSFGSAGGDVIYLPTNNFSYILNTRNDTLDIKLLENGTWLEIQIGNVSNLFYIYYVGVFGFYDSNVAQVPAVTQVSTGIQLWTLGIIPAALLVAVILHDGVNWLLGGKDKDSIFFWRNAKKGDKK